jgi:hypothetical protein
MALSGQIASIYNKSKKTNSAQLNEIKMSSSKSINHNRLLRAASVNPDMLTMKKNYLFENQSQHDIEENSENEIDDSVFIDNNSISNDGLKKKEGRIHKSNSDNFKLKYLETEA